MKNLLYINREIHPLDILEDIAECENFTFTRSSPDELDLSISGKNCNYNINFNWNNKLEGIHVALFFDTKIPQYRLDEIYKLTIKINELMWLGHFDVWTNELKLLFRYNLLLSGGVLPTTSQCQSLFKHIMDTADKYYPSFQYVIWGGNKADEAITNAIFTTIGES